jgi:DNA-directed RNA polymerase beta' subunit
LGKRNDVQLAWLRKTIQEFAVGFAPDESSFVSTPLINNAHFELAKPAQHVTVLRMTSLEIGNVSIHNEKKILSVLEEELEILKMIKNGQSTSTQVNCTEKSVFIRFMASQKTDYLLWKIFY